MARILVVDDDKNLSLLYEQEFVDEGYEVELVSNGFEAIEQVKSLAGIEEAQVVEYRRPFSLTSFLRSQSKSFPKLDRTTLYELSTPQLLYLWTIYE